MNRGGWRKGLAIFGIVVGFPLFLTIPGWMALSSYRKWQRGEKDAPLLPWYLGACGLIALVGIAISLAIARHP